MPTRINTLSTLAAARAKAQTMTRPTPRAQTLRDAPGRVWVDEEVSVEVEPLALNVQPLRSVTNYRKRRSLHARYAGCASELPKAQLRDVSSAVPGVGESQRAADFRGSFAFRHKGFAARIQVTY
jgi:hypothetical protein